MQFDFPLGL